MMNVLTYLSKVDRVSRSVNPATFTYNPGKWAEIDSTGTLTIPADGTPCKLPALVMGDTADNKYEGHDTSVGRVSTIESYGVRVEVDTDGYAGTINSGDLLFVSAETASKGKLIASGSIVAAGTYVAVAKAHTLISSKLTYVTLSPSTTFVKA
jgi:hypothetical protein